MQTLETVRRRIGMVDDLQSVVKTMKALAAVNIRQYEKAVRALDRHVDALEKSLQALLRFRGGAWTLPVSAPGAGAGCIVCGSDQGMCGQLNDRIVTHAGSLLRRQTRPVRIAAIGARVRDRLEDIGYGATEFLTVPTAAERITVTVQEIVMIMERWRFAHNVGKIQLLYSKYAGGASYRPHTIQLLPLNSEWLHRITTRKWQGTCVPLISMDWNAMLAAVIRQHFFIELFRGFAESLASENASRLAAMQGAEKNIQEKRHEVTALFRRMRQEAITEELMDIVGGYAALGAGAHPGS